MRAIILIAVALLAGCKKESPGNKQEPAVTTPSNETRNAVNDAAPHDADMVRGDAGTEGMRQQ